MHISAKLLYARAKKLHEEIIRQMIDLKKYIEGCTEETELADAAFALEKSAELIKDARKEIDKVGKLAKYKTCLVWTQNQLEIQDAQPIRTAYCTATPKVDMYVPMPTKKGNSGWDELMEHLGIPGWVADAELVRPHYPSMLEYTTECFAQAKPIPPGMDIEKKIPLHDLKFRRTKTAIA